MSCTPLIRLGNWGEQERVLSHFCAPRIGIYNCRLTYDPLAFFVSGLFALWTSPSGSYWRVEIQVFRLPVFSLVLAETRGDQVKEMPRTPFPGLSWPCRLSFGWLTELSNANGPSPSPLISDILFNQLFKALSIFLSGLA